MQTELTSFLDAHHAVMMANVNRDYLMLARDLASSRVGRELIGLANNPDLARRIAELTANDITQLSRCGFCLVGLRITSAKLIDSLAEPLNQNAQAYAYLSSKSDAVQSATQLNPSQLPDR